MVEKENVYTGRRNRRTKRREHEKLWKGLDKKKRQEQSSRKYIDGRHAVIGTMLEITEWQILLLVVFGTFC